MFILLVAVCVCGNGGVWAGFSGEVGTPIGSASKTLASFNAFFLFEISLL